MLRKALYPKVENLLNRAATKLRERGISPNQLTLAGLSLAFLTGWIYASGNMILAGLVLILASAADLLDGPLARVSGRASKFGAFLDSTVDRYSDFFIFGGLALFFAKRGESGWFLVTMGTLLGAFVTSYTKARAENFIARCDVGIFERSERILALCLGSIIFPFLPLMLWTLLIGTHLTALQRILFVRQALAGNPAQDESP